MRVVLLPGLRGDTREFAPLLERLPGARAYRLPMIDADRLSDIAAALPDLRDVDVLIGASFGGLVARALVAEGGTNARLVLLGALPHPVPPPAARRCAWLGRIVPQLPSPLYRSLYARRAAREWAEDTDVPWIPDLPPAAILGARLRAIARWGLPPLPRGSICIWGARDRFVTWTADDVWTWGGVPVPLDAGHRPHLSRPDEVIHVIPTVRDPLA